MLLGARRERLWLTIALAWLLGFLLFFYSFELPNNRPTTRFDIWMILPTLLPPSAPSDPGAPYGWQNLPQRFDLMFVAGIILAGAWGAGHLLLRVINVPLEKRCAERTAFAFGLGLSALSLITLGCGLGGLLCRWILGGIIVAAVIAEAVLRWHGGSRSNFSAEASAKPASGKTCIAATTERSSLRWICLAAVSPFVLVMFLGAMLPPTDFDVRAYHLEGPKEFFQAGRISFLPHNAYTSFPFLTEMLSLLAMVLRDDWYRGALAGQLVLACFAPLTGVALYAAGRRWFSPAAGWLAVLVHLTTPWIYRISIIAYAEGGLAFYLLASLLAVAIGIERMKELPRDSHRLFFLTGLLAGNAMACKYTGLVQVVVPMGLAVCVAAIFVPGTDEHRSRRFIMSTAAFGLGVALTIGPWLVKNLVETGNPVYPLAYSIFGGADWDDALNVRFKHAHGPKNYSPADLWYQFIDVMARNDWLSPLLYGLAPLSLLVAARRKTVGCFWMYVAYLFLAFWLLTHRLDRFWVPMLPVVSLLAGIGAGWSRVPGWRWGAGLMIGLAVWFNLGFVTTGLCGNNIYLSDLEVARNNSDPAGIGFLNRTLPPGSKVLCIGEGEVFSARFPLVYNTVFDKPVLQEWCAADASDVPDEEPPFRETAEIRAQLAKEGITHVYVNWQWILTYRHEGNYGYSDFINPGRLVELQKRGVLGPAMQPSNADPRDWGIFYMEFKNASPEDRTIVEKWGPELRTNVRGTDALILRQIFPVIP